MSNSKLIQGMFQIYQLYSIYVSNISIISYISNDDLDCHLSFGVFVYSRISGLITGHPPETCIVDIVSNIKYITFHIVCLSFVVFIHIFILTFLYQEHQTTYKYNFLSFGFSGT